MISYVETASHDLDSNREAVAPLGDSGEWNGDGTSAITCPRTYSRSRNH